MDLIQELDIKVIDCDTHIVEAYDLWTSRVSVSKYGERVPHVKKNEQGVECWYSNGEMLTPAAGIACAGYREHPPRHAATLEDIDMRAYEPQARLGIMDEYGIHAQVLYPNVAGFGAGRYLNFGDMDLALLLLQAYNDHLADYAATDRDRFIPVMAVPFWDIGIAIKEIERAAALGHKGLIFSQQPEGFGCPRLSDPHWDPIWSRAQEMGLSVNFHIGSGNVVGADMNMLHDGAGLHANYASFPVTFFIGNCRTIATLIGGGVCHRFPKLKFVSVESGVGWIPFALQGLDWMWKECGVHKEHPEFDLLPSEYFRRQIYGCFWFEHGPTLDAAIDYLGADNVLYETDFPHPTSMSPGPCSEALPARRFISERLGHLPPETLRKILHDNAASLYHMK